MVCLCVCERVCVCENVCVYAACGVYVSLYMVDMCVWCVYGVCVYGVCENVCVCESVCMTVYGVSVYGVWCVCESVGGNMCIWCV